MERNPSPAWKRYLDSESGDPPDEEMERLSSRLAEIIGNEWDRQRERYFPKKSRKERLNDWIFCALVEYLTEMKDEKPPES